MELKKVAGYVVSLIGIVILAVGVIPALKTSLGFIPASITGTHLMIGGTIIAIAGVFLSFSKDTQKASEVPIYHGKEIVGFRRVGK